MLQKLLEKLFGRHTVEDALVHFNFAIDKLEKVERQEVAEMERRKQDLAEAAAGLETATRNATIARNKAAKIRDFIGDSEDDLKDGINTLRAIA
jgi:hypothetical protein